MTRFLRGKVFTLAMMAFLALGAFGGAGVATPDKAAAAGCYDSATVHAKSFTGGRWTAWHYKTATSSCADLNVAITNHHCAYWVDAMYYNPSTGQWVDAAYDDRWVNPGVWYAPITNVRDGTNMAVRFYIQCSDSSATLFLAA